MDNFHIFTLYQSLILTVLIQLWLIMFFLPHKRLFETLYLQLKITWGKVLIFLVNWWFSSIILKSNSVTHFWQRRCRFLGYDFEILHIKSKLITIFILHFFISYAYFLFKLRNRFINCFSGLSRPFLILYSKINDQSFVLRRFGMKILNFVRRRIFKFCFPLFLHLCNSKIQYKLS